MSFAALSAAAVAASISRLGEHTAVFDDGTPAGVSVDCIFDSAFRLTDIGLGVESYAPALSLASSAVPAGTAHGTAVTIKKRANGSLVGAYTVTGIQPDSRDGQGLTVLILTEAET